MLLWTSKSVTRKVALQVQLISRKKKKIKNLKNYASMDK